MPDNILGKIVANKRQELSQRKQLKTIESIKINLKRSERSFYDALNNDRADFIFECKKASPSKGLLNKEYDLDKILSVYKDYASAISVLTDYKYFKGSFEHLVKVTQNVKQPVLCKDFFIDPYQVYEARYYGADAILLMLSVVDDRLYKQLAEIAAQINLDVLTEVHDVEELRRAINLNAKIIGINNRNLKDLSIDLKTTEALISQLPENIDPEIIFISESGISNHVDVKRLAPLVSGFLVGSSIMSQSNIRIQCKELIYGTTKICGITNKEIAQTAFEQGAIYGGLIFYPKSPRYVDLNQAMTITATVNLDYVGVFVNETIDNVVNIASQLKLKVIQLHGEESEEYIQLVKRALPEIDIWKVLPVEEKSTSEQALNLNNINVSRYLLDTHHVNLPGGSGQKFDWSIVEQLEKEKIVVAGGINIDNVLEARQLNTFAIDINSGVEDSPGNKCASKITSIFKKLRA